MISTRSLTFSAIAIAGAATWAWSQEPSIAGPDQVPISNDLEVRAISPRGSGVPADRSPSIVNGAVGGEYDPATVSVVAGTAIPAYRAVTRPKTVMETFYVIVRPEEIAEQKEMQGLIGVLHSDKTAEEKAKATASLNSLLQKQFTRDLERREKEVSELEERVRKLRSQVDRRKEARDKIIGLRLTTIQNEAEGLGFPGQERSGGGVPVGPLAEPTVTPYEAPTRFVPSPAPTRDR